MADNIEKSGATARVFGMFELLEKILININTFPYEVHGWPKNVWAHVRELQALFRLQRINTTFRDVINRSKTLRRSMYKEISHNEDKQEDASHDTDNDDRLSYVKEMKAMQRHMNPVVAQLSKLLPVVEFDFWNDGIDKAGNIALGVCITVQDSAELRPDCASWRKLLIVSKPALFPVHLGVQWHGYVSHTYVMKLEKGATLGELTYEIMEKVRDHVEDVKENPDSKLRDWVAAKGCLNCVSCSSAVPPFHQRKYDAEEETSSQETC